MINRWIQLVLILFFYDTVVYASSTSLDNHQQAFNHTSSQLQQLIKNGTLDGVSIGVVNENGLVWFNNFGYANYQQQLKTSENTVYRVGSLAKLLTATAILQLEEQGIIDIDQAVSAYIPGFNYKTRFSEPGVITSRDLITHLSGLPSNINKGHWTEERFTVLVERLHSEYASYPADFILNYSNVGYSLLGTIIEENTDYLFEEYIQKHIFHPLQMTRSNFQPYGSTIDDTAIGYHNHQPQINLPLRDIPALGLNSSLLEMSHFIASILNKGVYKGKRILDEDSVESMYTVQNGDIELDFDNFIGMPWFIKSVKTEQQNLIIEHGGTTINFSSQIMLAPHQKLGIIILTNTSQVNTVINKIAEQLLNTLINNNKKDIVNYIADNPLNKKTKDNSKNRYIAKSGIIEIDKNSSKLCDCQNNRKINLVPLPDGWFGLSPDNKKYNSKITEKIVDGNEIIVLEHNGKKHRIGSRYIKNENNFNWEQYFGDYKIINPDKDFPVTDIRVFDKDNMTYMCYRMPKLSSSLIVLPITPVSSHEAITEGLGRSKGETIFSQNINGNIHLIYSGYIARKVN